MAENNFELPLELSDSSSLMETNYLSGGADVSSTLRFNEAGEIVNFKNPETIHGNSSRDRGTLRKMILFYYLFRY